MKRPLAGLIAGLLVPLVALGVFLARRGDDDIDAKLAEAEGVPLSALREINRADHELSRKRNIDDEQWRRLLELSRDKSQQVRFDAFDAIANAYGTPRAPAALAEIRRMRSDRWESIRGGYVFALIRLRAPDWRQAADEAARDPSELVREVSKDAVGRVEQVYKKQDRFK